MPQRTKLCKASFYPQLSSKTFVRLVEAQIVFKHLKQVVPLIKDPNHLFTVMYCGNAEIEEAVQKDVNFHLTKIFERNYQHTLEYLFDNGLYLVMPDPKELLIKEERCSKCISKECQFHPRDTLIA